MRSQRFQQVSFKPFNAETFRSTLQRAFHCDISNAETPCEPTQMPQRGGGGLPTRGASGEHVARCLQVNRAQTRMIARAAIHLRRLGDGLLDGVRC